MLRCIMTCPKYNPGLESGLQLCVGTFSCVRLGEQLIGAVSLHWVVVWVVGSQV